ncbi:MAG: 16S rRNA (uracil(1498)-N(3))-methyltransferase [Chlorobi bacterium]|nr:16S rRNA (uracil(1498)-N(3))-methyltransferase [Chlorobiota bacterium]
MQLFYTPDINSDIYTLNEQESKHCIRVLRLKIGDEISLTDGVGNMYFTKIIEDHSKRCTVQVMEVKKEYGKRPFKIHIAIAPTKNIARTEWFIEKATEIGIDEITPLICEHSERKAVKTERLFKVITSAVKQSLKAYHPVMNDAVEFKKFVRQEIKGAKFIAYCSDEYRDSLKNIYTKGEDALVLIGPEGDFSPEEVDLAINHGFKPVSLGSSRLRTETAALYACCVVNLRNE